MSKQACTPGLFAEAAESLLRQGFPVRFSARGTSMGPLIRDGEQVSVEPVATESLKPGDVVLYRSGSGVRAHRIIGMNRLLPGKTHPPGRHQAPPAPLQKADHDGFAVKGLSPSAVVERVAEDEIFGRVVSVKRRGRQVPVTRWMVRWSVFCNRSMAFLRRQLQ